MIDIETYIKNLSDQQLRTELNDRDERGVHLGKLWPVPIPVAGISFRVKSMAEIKSDEVLLQADPTNEHDPNAIQVLIFNDPVISQIGFIPRDIAASIDHSQLPSKGRIVWRSTDEKGVGVRIFI